jgi:hypothetical protein
LAIGALRALPIVAIGAVIVTLPIFFLHALASNEWDHHDAGARERAVRSIATARTVTAMEREKAQQAQSARAGLGAVMQDWFIGPRGVERKSQS